MNWAAALYAAGIWLLAASAWTTIRPPLPGRANARVAYVVGRELLAALLLAILLGLLI
jgi:hypothetical protein